MSTRIGTIKHGGHALLALATLALSLPTACAAQAADGPLQVRRISPSDSEVQPGQEIVIQFDRTMVALGDMTRTPRNAHVHVAPDPGCEWRWLDTTELACRLQGKKRLRPATKYTVTVDTAMQAHDGSHLDAPVTRTFTTWLPAVTGARFMGWKGPTHPRYMLRFNMPVTAHALASALLFENGEGHVATKVTPFTTERQGPLLLPVPGAPGALLIVDDPSPRTALDAGKRAGQARRVWTVEPEHPLQPDTDYSMDLRAGLHSPAGPLPGKAVFVDGKNAIHTFGAFRFLGIDCGQYGRYTGRLWVVPGQATPKKPCVPDDVNLDFSAPVPRKTLASIRWQPRPPTDLRKRWKNYPQWFLRERRDPHAGGAEYPLTFKLAAMHPYRLSAPGGIRDVFGRPLQKPASVSFRTGHYTPFADLPYKPAVLEAGEPTILPVRYTNLKKLAFDYRRLHAGDLRSGHAPAGAVKHTQDLLGRSNGKTAYDRIEREPLGLRKLLDHRSGVAWGLFAVQTMNQHDPERHPNSMYRPPKPTYRFFQVTPYQVFAKMGHFNSLVWISRFGNGQPVAGATVRLWTTTHNDFSQLQPAKGTSAIRTDADGLAVLPGNDVLATRGANFLSVTQGDDMALLPLNYAFLRQVFAASHDRVWANIKPRNGHIRAWMVSSQGIYRPGSEVRFSVFARNQNNDTLIAPPAIDYTLKVVDPAGNTVLVRKNVKLSAFGDAQFHLHVAPNAPTGNYGVTLSWNQQTRSVGSFMVTEYVPAPFHVQASIHGERFGPGDVPAIGASARLHAGGPYTHAKVRFTTQIIRRTFAPDTPQASRFSFMQANAFDPDSPIPASVTVAQTHARLDQNGHATANIPLPKKSRIIYGRLSVEAAVQSVRATQVAAHASATYAARDRFIGMHTGQWLQTAHKPFKVQFLVVNVDGKPQAGSASTLKLQRHVVDSTQVKNAAGEFRSEQHMHWVTEDTCKAVSGTAPSSCTLTPEHPGDYRILASVKDTRGRIQQSALWTWVTGPGEVVWDHQKGITMVPDKSHYHVGDTAHVMVKNPYPGARALVTVERYGVLWKHMVTLKGGAPVIDVPIGRHFFPGAYLSITIFSPRVSPPGDPDLGKPQIAMGYLALHVRGKGSALRVAVTPDAPRHKPRETVHVKVAVSTRDGKPAGRTRLVVAVVDQSVLDLLKGGTGTFDPLKSFYAPPSGPDMANYSLASQLVSMLRPRQGKGLSPGGGGGQSTAPNVRSQFKSAVYWNPTLTTDASGHATFHFKLPDNLTRWRILVVAMSPGAAMGLGDASVRVNLPLQVQPALPNQIHVGDRFGAAFDVTNRTATTRTVQTRVTAHGPIEGTSAEQTATLRLGRFDHGLTWLHVAAVGTGTIRFTASARSGPLGDAMTTTIPVRRAGATEVAAQYGNLDKGRARIPVKLPAGAIPDSARLKVIMAPTLVGGLDGAFEYMRNDRLCTWEIRLSRGVLASDYLRLKPVIGKTFDWPGAAHDVSSMLNDAADFQAPDGGMAFWYPRTYYVSPYLSVYTALAFQWLRRDGHAPPVDVEHKLHGYLRRQILGSGRADGANLVLRAGALAALAPDGHLPRGAINGMLAELHKMDLFGQALLLRAALDTHDNDSARRIVKSLYAHAEESAGSISFNERDGDAYVDLLSTPLRSNCAVLDALVEYKKEIGDQGLLGDTPGKLMRWISRQRRNSGGWPNSQENVFCTSAIVHYADVYEHPVHALEGQVDVAGKAQGKVHFDARSNPGKAIDHDLDPSERNTPFDVDVDHGGRGRLYYNVRLSYAMPPDALGSTDAGMTIGRAYFVRRGTHWQPVKQGTVLRRGDIVRVDLTVDTPTERHFVVVSDPLPGAFEAVNRQLATSASSAPSASDGVQVLMFDSGPWPNMSIVQGGFYHRQIALDAVRFYADDLPAGRYRLVYSAQVISPGHFIAPAPRAKEIYQPDVFGRGRARHIIVQSPGH